MFGPFVERQTLALAAHPDVELRVVAPIGIPPWPLSRHPRYRQFDAVPPRENWRGLDVYRPRFRHWPGSGGRFDAASLARRLLPLLGELRDAFPFDVIDAEFFFPDGPAAVSLGRALGVPVSVKARGADIHHWGRAAATAAPVLVAARAADGLLAVSAALRDDMIALGMPADRITVHHTGVDLEAFAVRDRAEAKAALGIAGPLVASVGALIPRKGQTVLIDALARLPGVTLVLIGAGPDEVALKDRAARAGLAGRVRFTGALPARQIAHWLAAADVMALASASEGLANVWVEALACGTPVVITEAGGAREVLTDPAGGVIAARDPAAFAAAVAALIAQPPDRQAVRALALPFTWERNTKTLVDHLTGIAERRRK